jgi:hypothetical protein
MVKHIIYTNLIDHFSAVVAEFEGCNGEKGPSMFRRTATRTTSSTWTTTATTSSRCQAPWPAPAPVLKGRHHGLINYTEIKAKCRHLKKFTWKGTFRQVLICLRPPPLL